MSKEVMKEFFDIVCSKMSDLQNAFSIMFHRSNRFNLSNKKAFLKIQYFILQINIAANTLQRQRG